MNDYQLIHLAADRQHDFYREAAAHRLARGVAATPVDDRQRPQPGAGPRRTLRLTLDAILGRSV